MKNTNQIWDFFSSVRLAIFTLCSLALTSIIGTIIPQGQPSSEYVQEYGPFLAQLFQVLDLTNMYGSWWFLGLLGLLSANLIVCSFDRFPITWRLITADQLSISPERLAKMELQATWIMPISLQETTQNLKKVLKATGWTAATKDEADEIVISSQKGAWSRLGVYVVHLSILVIFLGAIIGNFLGFKATVMIPETESTTKVYGSGNSQPIDLGFEIRCDFFEIEFYPNGMPKEYRSRLTVKENGKDVHQQDIEVNEPLTYKGITFYQSSYEGYKDFLLKFSHPTDQTSTTFKAPFQNELEWPDKNLRFGIINAETKGNQVLRSKIWMREGDKEPTTFWLATGDEAEIEVHGQPLVFSAKQMYATGLQVAKDPGVWLVYTGCLLMLLGLYMAFFISHRRIWLILRKDGNDQTVILLAGSTNKNKSGFAGSFSELEHQLRPNS